MIGGDFGIGTNFRRGTSGELPLFERFFPGGIGSVRGYEYYRLGPREVLFNQFGQPFAFEDVGGSKELILTNEVTFPLIEGLGIRGVVFLDAGNSFRLRESIGLNKLQAAYGLGIRWRSPFGPLRIEFGFPINPRQDDVRTDFIFGAGGNL
jgi:outer membrane protein insertion porin family